MAVETSRALPFCTSPTTHARTDPGLTLLAVNMSADGVPDTDRR